jgi:hypothetical protein
MRQPFLAMITPLSGGDLPHPDNTLPIPQPGRPGLQPAVGAGTGRPWQASGLP